MIQRGTSGAVSAPEPLGALGVGDIAPPCVITDPCATIELNLFDRDTFISRGRDITGACCGFTEPCVLSHHFGTLDERVLLSTVRFLRRHNKKAFLL